MLPNSATVCAAVLALSFAAGVPVAKAADADPAATQIESFDNSLLEVMKQASALGARGRERKLTPTIERTFDIPAMTRFAVGPTWASMSDADHTALIEAFKRYTAASYAHNFDGFSGERFTVEPKVETRGPDKIVQSHIFPAHDAPVLIAYRMRNSGGTWKVIDVYFQGTISQLTTRRSDFAATVASGGAHALIAHLDAQAEKLLR